MQPTRALWENMQNLQAADVATLAAAAGLKVHLAVAAFVPSLDRVVADFTEATFTGYAPLTSGNGTQKTYYDITTGLRVIELLTPAGGWTWKCTSTPTPAQTIYGWYVTDSTGATLYACQLLAAPVTINLTGQGVDIGSLKLNFSTSSPT